MKQSEYSNQYKECKVSPIVKTKIRLVLIAVMRPLRRSKPLYIKGLGGVTQ
jgi:hypothetical protein